MTNYCRETRTHPRLTQQREKHYLITRHLNCDRATLPKKNQKFRRSQHNPLQKNKERKKEEEEEELHGQNVCKHNLNNFFCSLHSMHKLQGFDRQGVGHEIAKEICFKTSCKS